MPVINPWLGEQLAANPGLEGRDLVPRCKVCGFTFPAYHCRPSEDEEGYKCLYCVGEFQQEIYPCCWGNSHDFHPYLVPMSEFTADVTQLFCNACWVTPQPEMLPDDEAVASTSTADAQAPLRFTPAATLLSNGPSPRVLDDSMKKFYGAILLMQDAMVKPPMNQQRLQDLLARWLGYFRSSECIQPYDCLNCLQRLGYGDPNPFCRRCRNPSAESNWVGFQACPRCHVFRPGSHFVGPTREPVITCCGCRAMVRALHHRAREARLLEMSRN